MKTTEELKQERLLLAVNALLRIRQEIDNTIIKVSQLDGAIETLEEQAK